MMDSEHPVEITDDEIARDIGRVVMAWSQLEMMLSSLLTVILGAQEGIARVIIAGKSFRQMADLLAALVDARAEPDRDG